MDENTFDEKTYHFISDIEQIISNVKKRSNCMKYPKTYKYDKNVIRDEVLNLIIIMKELHKLYYANYPDNHPLYGDQRYGIRDNKQIALLSYKLEFEHPVKKEVMTFEISPPNSEPWKTLNCVK